jgi:hypothetical protein
MDFFQHTENWIKGEIFEASIFGSFGLFSIIVGLLFLKFGTTPNAKALIIPLIVIGIFFVGTAISSGITNKKRWSEFNASYVNNKAKFVEGERARVVGFQYMYTATVCIAVLCFVIAITSMLFAQSATWKGIGIGLAIFGITGLIIDFFSKERADVYYIDIIKELNK